MGEDASAGEIEVLRPDGARLAGEVSGEGPLVVLLHGLTATRRYVLLGSRALERAGYRVAAYDARGHGESGGPEAPEAYEYSDLVADLGAVLDELGHERAILVGNSMGAHTAAAFAVEHSERVGALVVATPAYDGRPIDPEDAAEWDRLAVGLREAGVDGFLDAHHPDVAEGFRETVETFTRQRLERHHDVAAVADALAVVPRSRPFGGLEVLEALEAPALVVGSRDAADPGHPLRVARSWAERIPDAELRVEEEGSSPLAWQGAQLSRAIEEFLDRRGTERSELAG